MKMESLKKRYFSLDSKVELYLPTMTATHEPIGEDVHDAMRIRIAQKMSSLFGGATVTRAMGFYENAILSRTQLEEVEIIYSYCQNLEPSQVTELINLAIETKSTLSQESVMLVINGTALFI